jgi:hypothetical protein
MNWIVAVFFIFFANLSLFAAAPLPSSYAALSGEVLEVQDVANYTYLRLKTADAEVWAAVTTAALRPGATVTIKNAVLMDNFESKALKKTFAQIYFGSLSTAPPGTADAPASNPHTPAAGMPQVPMAQEEKLARASGPEARTVAEIVTGSAALKDKSVTLRARVVKYSADIMGKNWLHLRDGSGSAADASNDLLATTREQAQVGDVLLVTGVVRQDKDFGSGYAYKVLIEDATLLK